MNGRRFVAAGVIVVTGLTARVHAVAADEPEGRHAPRWSASLEMSLLFSPREGDRRDVAGWAAIVPRFHGQATPSLAVTVGVALPIPPLVAFHLPIGVEWSVRSPRRGPLLRGHVRPLWGVVDLCGSGGTCPLDEAADPYDRGAAILGAAVDVGGAYRFRLGAWSLELAAAYAIGQFDGRARKTEPAIDGAYQGFILELGVLR